jgi:threonine aldolase
MRQSGILASACIYALDNNIERLPDDHRRAKQLAEALKPISWIKQVLPVETNILIFEVEDAAKVAGMFEEKQILVQPFSSTLVRLVTHLDFTEEMLQSALAAIGSFR